MKNIHPKDKRIGIVDGENNPLHSIADFLTLHQWNVLVYNSSQTFSSFWNTEKFDLLLFYLNTKPDDAISLCASLKKSKKGQQIPIVILSEDKSDFVEITAFNMGADDYLLLPLNAFILEARLKNLISHFQSQTLVQPDFTNVFLDDKIRVDFNNRVIQAGQEKISLTKIENDIFQLLVQNVNRIVSKKKIEEVIWATGEGKYKMSRTIDLHMLNLRKKINKKIIRTIKGVGYILESRISH